MSLEWEAGREECKKEEREGRKEKGDDCKWEADKEERRNCGMIG